MESLLQVASGDDDVVVAISGFGSAKVGGERWRDMAGITGRSVFYLKYAAQMLPWKEDGGAIWPPSLYYEMHERWKEAQVGAKIAAKYLASWLKRWAEAGRKILVVGFSLGAYVGWEAIKLIPDELKGHIELLMMSAALVDSEENWLGSDKLRRLVNVFSYDDVTLKYLYPMAVGEDETPAAGLGPLVISDRSNVDNVDLTDMIGRDHLWGSANIHRLVRAGLGCLWTHRLEGELCPVDETLAVEGVADISEQSAQRLYRWMVVDPEYWKLMAHGLDGNRVAVSRLEALDAWSLGDMRLSALLDAGSASVSLLDSNAGRKTAIRGLQTLSGMVRHWVEKSGTLADS